MTRRILGLLGVLVALAPGTLRAQNAQEIMERAWDVYRERMTGIEDYTVTQTVMGMASTMYFVRDEIDGRVVFLPDMTQMQETGPGGEAQQMNTPRQFDGQYFMRPEIAERMTVEGRESVDGNECWIIALDDFEGIELGGMGGVQSTFTPESMRMWMDTDELIPRRIDMAGTMAGSAGPQPLSSSALMMDYREVEGMLYPFRVEISSEGLGGAMSAGMGGMTPEQQEAMEEMEAELEKMPPEQRAMVEQMMKGQMGGGMQEMMEEALSAMVVETTEVRVNAGPPGGP
jgi:hypothetical protein